MMKERGLIILIVAIILVGLLVVSGMNNFSFDLTPDNHQNTQQQSDNNDNNNIEHIDNGKTNNEQNKQPENEGTQESGNST